MSRELTPANVVQARALLNWSRDRLAVMADIGLYPLVKFERGQRDLDASADAAIRAALEAAGLEFIAESAGGSVRLGNKHHA